jgi:hypothetical protein
MPEARRTLVKSPPELWAEVSDPDCLARHLEAFGEIKITRVEPETALAWESDHATGTVALAPSGWGTKVIVTAESAEPKAVEPEAVAEPEPEPEPEPASDRRAELQRLLRAAEAEAERRRADTVDRDAVVEAADERLQEARRTLRRLESEAAAALDAVTDAEEAALAAEREVRRLRGLLRRAG